MGLIQIHEQEVAVEVLGGTGTATFDYVHGEMTTVVVTPPNEATTYDVSIVNRFNRSVFNLSGQEGTATVNIPHTGVRYRPSVTITNANPATGTFYVYIAVKDHG